MNYYDPNLPPQLSRDENFNNEPEPRMKICECLLRIPPYQNVRIPFGYSKYKYDIYVKENCKLCNGTGEVEMTDDELSDEADYNKEKNLDL